MLALFDLQIPHQINLKPVFDYQKDLKPDILVFGGDILDCEALQGYRNRTPQSVDWDEIHEEIKQCNVILDQADGISPKAEKHFWMGNHEERLTDFIETYPKFKSIVPNLVKELHLRERGYRVHGQHELVRFGKLWVYHGDYYGTFHTRKNVYDYERNLLYGHVHAPQMYTKVNPITEEPHQSHCAPCLCDKNPVWLEGKPNAWVNGFTTVFFQDNGHYNLYMTNIIKGKCVAPNGKEYVG